MRPQQVQLYGKYQSPPGYGNPALQTYYQPIDLSLADPIVYSAAVTDLEDPTVVVSAFSQTFRVPATAKNSIFFSMAFEVNSDDFNPTLKVDAFINVEGIFFAQGYIRLMKIYLDGFRDVTEFEIQFVGQTRSFGGAIEGKFLAQLDLTAYNHLLTYTNVVQSWNAGTANPALLNGDVIYPLCEWGYDYNPEISRPIIPTVSVYDALAPNPTSLNGFTNSSNPLFATQFKPFLRAKVIWDQIFAEAGYTYESTFLAGGTGSFFDQLYYTSTRDATSRLFIGTPFTNSFGPPVIVNLPVTLQQYIRIVFATNPPDQDYYNSYDPTLGLYYCPLDIPNMNHTMSLRFEYGTPGSTSPQFTIRLRRNRPTTGITTVYTQTVTGLPAAPVNNAQYNATFSAILGAQQVGDIFSWEILFPLGLFSNVRISGNRWTIDFPFGVNLSMMFPEDQYTQAEFIKGINNKFNLIWEPDPDNPNNFFIEPWINWVANGAQYSWTDKLDESEQMEVEPLFASQSRKLVFVDAEAGDLNNFNFQQQYNKIFGQLNIDSGIELLTDERDISTTFAPVPLSPIGVSNQMLIPHFAVDSETERTPMQVGPRLVFYNGLIDNPPDVPTWYLRSDLNVAVAFAQFPLVSQYSEWPPTDAFDLNWTNSPQYWDPDLNDGITGQVSNNAYTVFWEKWYQAFYSPYSRILRATFVLNSDDIKYLRFNDLIYIKNAWWMPVKYQDFALGEIQKVQVEFVKFWPALGISIGGTGNTSPINFYFAQQTCFGTTVCEACCCNISNPVVYSDGQTLASSNFVYLTSNGGFPAAGYYAQDGYAYQVLSDGSIIGRTLCASCDCAQLIPEFLTEYVGCSGPTPCDSFCCGATADIYIDGPITGATELFSSAGADPLTPFNWYHIPGTDWIYQVGANGYTVVQGGTGGPCNCPELLYSEVLSTAIGASGPESSCCVQGVTGASGALVVWFDDPDFYESTEFAEDTFNDQPLGIVEELYISDGQYWVGVTAGAPGSTGDCTVNVCPDRTNQVDTRLINLSGVTGATLTVQNYITYDFSTPFWANQDSASGTTFNYNWLTGYDPNSGIVTQILPGTNGSISAVVNKDSGIIYQDTFPVTAGSSHTLPTFAAGTASWFIEIEIIPT